jgi:hypothetical protein
MKQFLIFGLALIGAYATFEWWTKNPRSPGGPNVNALEVSGVATSNATAGNQLTSGIPTFDPTPIANGHGDQVSAAYSSNAWSTSNGGPNYEPAFGPKTNR